MGIDWLTSFAKVLVDSCAGQEAGYANSVQCTCTQNAKKPTMKVAHIVFQNHHHRDRGIGYDALRFIAEIALAAGIWHPERDQ